VATLIASHGSSAGSGNLKMYGTHTDSGGSPLPSDSDVRGGISPFAVSSGFWDLTTIKLDLRRVLTNVTPAVAGNVEVEIKTGSLDGTVVASATLDRTTLAEEVQTFAVITFSSGQVSSGTNYYLVVKDPQGFRDDQPPGPTDEIDVVEWRDNPSGGSISYRHDTTNGWLTRGDNRFIFELYGDAATPTKATNPAPSDTATDVTNNQATITWDDGGGADTFNVYYGTVSGSLSVVSSAQAGTSFTVTGITDGSPYNHLSTRYWRIDSTNASGTTTGDEWSFTTLRIDPPGKTYFYTVTGQYYRLLVQADGSLGDPPGTGVENTDFVYLAAGYEANFISTNRRLVAIAENRFWFEDI